MAQRWDESINKALGETSSGCTAVSKVNRKMEHQRSTFVRILGPKKKPLHVNAGACLFWLLNLGSNQGPTD